MSCVLPTCVYELRTMGGRANGFDGLFIVFQAPLLPCVFVRRVAARIVKLRTNSARPPSRHFHALNSRVHVKRIQHKCRTRALARSVNLWVTRALARVAMRFMGMRITAAAPRCVIVASAAALRGPGSAHNHQQQNTAAADNSTQLCARDCVCGAGCHSAHTRPTHYVIERTVCNNITRCYAQFTTRCRWRCFGRVVVCSCAYYEIAEIGQRCLHRLNQLNE